MMNKDEKILSQETEGGPLTQAATHQTKCGLFGFGKGPKQQQEGKLRPNGFDECQGKSKRSK